MTPKRKTEKRPRLEDANESAFAAIQRVIARTERPQSKKAAPRK